MRPGFLRALPPNHRASLPGSLGTGQAPRVGIPGAAVPVAESCCTCRPGPSPAAKAGSPASALETLPPVAPRAALNAGGSRRCFPRSAGQGDGAGRNFSPDGFRAAGCGVFGSRIPNAPSGAGRSRRRISGRRPPLGAGSGHEPPASAFRASGRAFPVPRDRQAQRVGTPGAAAPRRVLRQCRSRAPATRKRQAPGRRQNVLRDRISGRRHPDSPRVGLRPLGRAFRVSPGLAPELSARPSRPTFGTAPRIRVGAQIGAHSRPAPPLTRAGPSSRAS